MPPALPASPRSFILQPSGVGVSRWRVMVVVALLVGPFVLLAGIGSYYLMTQGWWIFAWVGLLVCMGIGYGLAWYWQRNRSLLRPLEIDQPLHWTKRDQEAWNLVLARAAAAAKVPAETLAEIPYYLSTAQEMAQELAAFYNPGATDPVSNLTVPEALAIIELASGDLWELVDQHLPGGHLLSISDWKRAHQAVGYYQTASKVYWIGAALWDPVTTGARYLASQLGVAAPLAALQGHLFRWFYEAFVHRVGTYLIEVHSGRLRLGAGIYRRRLKALLGPPTEGASGEAEDATDQAVERTRQVTVTLTGQVKAGKSSLVNALLGEQRARTDVLPATSGIDRYELSVPAIPTKLVLLDTVGYAHTGPKADQLAATREAARQSDLILLVLHARNPGRQADLEQVRDLQTWFATQPELKKPPVIAVLTHIDLLSPALEWDPPYQLDPPIRPKEVNIRQALNTVFDQLGDHLTAAVPVCAGAGRVFGVEEWLLPNLVSQLDQVKAVAFLRCLKAEGDRAKVRKLYHQTLTAGKQLLSVLWAGVKKELKQN